MGHLDRMSVPELMVVPTSAQASICRPLGYADASKSRLVWRGFRGDGGRHNPTPCGCVLLLTPARKLVWSSPRVLIRSVGGVSALAAARGRASRSRGCGCSSTMAMGRGSPAARRCCSARGWCGPRFRVVVPLRDKTLPSVVIGLDRALRVFGARRCTRRDVQPEDGDGRSCGRDRGPQPADRQRGPALRLTIATCVPADPQSKAAQKPRSVWRKRIWFRPITTSARNTGASPSWSLRVRS